MGNCWDDYLLESARRQKRFYDNRRVFRIWNVKEQFWAAVGSRNRAGKDIFFRRADADEKVKDNPDLLVVECDLVPKDEFIRTLIERQRQND